jgi:single-strand DNA-binding protein
MPNLNKALLMGNLTRDPELRVTPKGTSICQFSLAINREWKTESGEKQEEVVFVDCECWGKAGETIAKYMTKGRPLYVEGRLKLDQWEDKTTREKRSKMKVVVEQFQFLGGPKDSPTNQQAERHQPPAQPVGAGAKPAPVENLDEDVPF